MQGVCLLLALTHLSAQEIVFQTEFKTLWWSEKQMENFDPNHPPPKTTPVTVAKWAYTDPVAVPHPDSITAHVVVRNIGKASAQPFRLVLETRWKEGPARAKKLARWTAAKQLKSFSVGELKPGADTAFEAPIAIKPRMDALDRRDWWPHEMQLIVTAQPLRAGSKPLARTVRPFPILRGD
jgi:hypothetical protein